MLSEEHILQPYLNCLEKSIEKRDHTQYRRISWEITQFFLKKMNIR